MTWFHGEIPLVNCWHCNLLMSPFVDVLVRPFRWRIWLYQNTHILVARCMVFSCVLCLCSPFADFSVFMLCIANTTICCLDSVPSSPAFNSSCIDIIILFLCYQYQGVYSWYCSLLILLCVDVVLRFPIILSVVARSESQREGITDGVYSVIC